MNPDYMSEDDDLWREYNDPTTTWSRRAEILYTFAYKAFFARDVSLETQYLLSAIEICDEHELVLERNFVLLVLARRGINTLNRPEESLEYSTRVIQSYPGFVADDDVIEILAEAYYLKGRALKRLNRPDEAINCFKAALDLDSLSIDRQNTALCYQYLGRSFLDIEDFASAKEPLKKARELYQADGQVGEVAETDRFLARILIHENKLEKAKRLLKEVRAVEQALYQRSNMQTKLLLATVHLKQKNYEEAEKLFRKCYQVAIKLTNGYAKMGVEAGLGLADALDGQERHEDANQVRLQVSSVVERRPDAKESDEKKVQEIEDFIKTGEPDLALAVAYDLLEEKNELGEISGHWLGIYHATRALWSKDDFQGIVDMFSNNSKQGLEFQDDIVIPLKNMVTHALSKVGRLDDALKLNEEVLADARLGQSLKETAYAHENRARILKKMRKADAYKFQKLAVKEYLELGDSTRALSLLQYWEEQRKKRWDNY